MKAPPPMEMINCFMEPCDSIYEARGRFTE